MSKVGTSPCRPTADAREAQWVGGTLPRASSRSDHGKQPNRLVCLDRPSRAILALKAIEAIRSSLKLASIERTCRIPKWPREDIDSERSRRETAFRPRQNTKTPRPRKGVTGRPLGDSRRPPRSVGGPPHHRVAQALAARRTRFTRPSPPLPARSLRHRTVPEKTATLSHDADRSSRRHDASHSVNTLRRARERLFAGRRLPCLAAARRAAHTARPSRSRRSSSGSQRFSGMREARRAGTVRGRHTSGASSGA